MKNKKIIKIIKITKNNEKCIINEIINKNNNKKRKKTKKDKNSK